MIFSLLLLLLWFESEPLSNAIILLTISNIIAPIVVGYVVYKLNKPKTQSEITKNDTDSTLAVLAKLIDLTNQFKLAQEQYILVTDRLVVVTRESKELIDLVEQTMSPDIMSPAIRLQVQKMKELFEAFKAAQKPE